MIEISLKHTDRIKSKANLEICVVDYIPATRDDKGSLRNSKTDAGFEC